MKMNIIHCDLDVAGCPTEEENFYFDQIGFFEKRKGDTWRDVEEEANDLYRYAKQFVRLYNKEK
jgi:hypothetical protein